MRRTNNQDSLICVPARSAEGLTQRGHLFVVADGMGAHAAGELASRMATDQIAQHYLRLAEHGPISDAIHDAITRANADIHGRGQSNPEFHNMGTTASTLVISPAGATIGHVGDSRVYRLRAGTLEQWTFDHSLVWELEASGQLNDSNRAGIPKNVITRSLGPSPEVQIDIEGPIDVAVGDRFLLCSDGLTGLVEDTEIASLMDCLPERTTTRVLIDLANLRGGSDNISVIVVEVTAKMAGATVPKSKRDPSNLPLGLWITGGVCLLAAAFLAVLGMYGPMVVAIALAVIAASMGGVMFFGPANKVAPTERRGFSGGKGPYRRFSAGQYEQLIDSLASTVAALRDAAKGSDWQLNWSTIDRLEESAVSERGRSDWKTAVLHEAEAVIETMNQLREQNNRAASETRD